MVRVVTQKLREYKRCIIGRAPRRQRRQAAAAASERAGGRARAAAAPLLPLPAAPTVMMATGCARPDGRPKTALSRSARSAW